VYGLRIGEVSILLFQSISFYHTELGMIGSRHSRNIRNHSSLRFILSSRLHRLYTHFLLFQYLSTRPLVVYIPCRPLPRVPPPPTDRRDSQRHLFTWILESLPLLGRQDRYLRLRDSRSGDIGTDGD